MLWITVPDSISSKWSGNGLKNTFKTQTLTAAAPCSVWTHSLRRPEASTFHNGTADYKFTVFWLLRKVFLTYMNSDEWIIATVWSHNWLSFIDFSPLDQFGPLNQINNVQDLWTLQTELLPEGMCPRVLNSCLIKPSVFSLCALELKAQIAFKVPIKVL